MTLRTKRTSVSKSLDYGVLLIYFVLLVLGWFTLKASVYSPESASLSYFDFSTPMGKHSAWVLIAIATMVVTLVIDWKLWSTFSYPIYAVTILLLLAVLLLGTEIKGARSWFTFGPISIQPSEFAKFGACLAVASYLSHYSVDIRQRKALLTVLAIIGVPMLLILLQSDAGSALVFTSFLILLYVKGLNADYYIYGGVIFAILIFSLMYSPDLVVTGALIAATILLLSRWLDARYTIAATIAALMAWFVSVQQEVTTYFMLIMVGVVVTLAIRQYLQRQPRMALLSTVGLSLCGAVAYGSSFIFRQGLQPHQQDRINVWLRPDKCDPQGSLYNVLQSKLAIGAGGFWGKGHLNGTMTKLNYVPEQSTDFIFSIVGEEQGFLGSLLVIGLFVVLLIRIVGIAERAKTPYVRCYAYGVAGIFFLHFIVNIGMSVGLMPIIGIPLPFLSKGGSALIAFTIMLGVLLRMDLSRHRA